jgi:hypothetical protein
MSSLQLPDLEAAVCERHASAAREPIPAEVVILARRLGGSR